MLFPQLLACFQENDVLLLSKTMNDQNPFSPHKINTKANGQGMRMNIFIREKLELNQFQTYHFFEHLGETFLVNLREDIKSLSVIHVSKAANRLTLIY